MNDIMKILTVIPTLFMPTSSIAGFFGMNVFQPTAPFPARTEHPAFYPMLTATVLTPFAMYPWIRRRD